MSYKLRSTPRARELQDNAEVARANRLAAARRIAVWAKSLAPDRAPSPPALEPGGLDHRKRAHIRVRSAADPNNVSFVMIIYGYTAREMMVIPPPVSPAGALERRGIDASRWVGSVFEVW